MIEVVLKPCPWCRKTPEILMPIHESTWCWTISCQNRKCNARPTTPYVAIRKTSKQILSRLLVKITMLADKWNVGNPFKPFEMKVIDTSKIKRFYGMFFPAQNLRITAKD